jgi:hypothetical protein
MLQMGKTRRYQFGMAGLRRGLVVLGLFGAFVGAAAQTVAVADDNLNITLQQVVQHSNDLQVQAIESRNLSLAADGLTDDYSKQVTANLQDMVDSKVYAISLLQVVWGPVTIAADGASATVTTYEAWRINSEAGSIDYDPVQNDYTLVLDNGTWKIKSDAQSTAPSPLPTSLPTPLPAGSLPSPTLTSTPQPTPTSTPQPTATSVPEPTPTSEPAPGEPEAPPPGEDAGG